MQKYFSILLLSASFMININAIDNLFAKIYLSKDFEIESIELENKEVSAKQFSDTLIKSGLSNEFQLKNGLIEWIKQNLIIIQQEGLVRKTIANSEFIISSFAKGLVIYKVKEIQIDQSKTKLDDNISKKQTISLENIVILSALGIIFILLLIMFVNQISLRRLTESNRREIKTTIIENSGKVQLDPKYLKEHSDLIVRQFLTSENAPYFPVILKNIQNLTEEIKNINAIIQKNNDVKPNQLDNSTDQRIKEILSQVDKLNISVEKLASKLNEHEKKIFERIDKQVGLGDLKL